MTRAQLIVLALYLALGLSCILAALSLMSYAAFRVVEWLYRGAV